MTTTALPVAVIGMSARVPGADDAEAFWDLLLEGRTTMEPVTGDRMMGFRPELAGVEKPWASLLDDIDGFDAELFGISPRMAAWLDPQQRLLLEASWHAFESAATVPETLAGSDTAVFVSTTAHDWRQRMADVGAVDRYSALGLLQTFLANRISYQYDLRGPSITLDTACSGGLTAVGMAVSGLRAGDYRCAVVASANHFLHGYMHAVMMRFGALSPTGQAASFDASADGYVRGEGAFCFVLKRLDDALADGDPVHAVIRGCRLNHDGRSGGMVLTDPEGQSTLVGGALAQAGLNLADIGYIEAHAAGTQLGDSHEVKGLLRLMESLPGGARKRINGPEGRLWLGSVKANIGHLEGSAGAAGLAKAILVLRHRAIPPTPGFRRLNHRIDLTDIPIAIAERTADWPDSGQGPRRAGVNSFGVGGANAHVVLEEPGPRPVREQPPVRTTMPVPLSTATEEAMPVLAARLEALLSRPGAPAFDAVAHTLQNGRAQLPIRRVLLARDNAELAVAASALARGAANEAVLVPDQTCEAFPAAQTWLNGGPADWADQWQGAPPPARIPLVPYPFQHRHLPAFTPDDLPEGQTGRPRR
ncbi:Ketoacyl-synthetase C-terminal extension [Nonomuraea solani]|uniref:Ketoacyl-synthetase C-terminal extension n=1 Tax=Nonomuraea solani TaxID=1144553 RepID=A0A1H5Y7U4_9ACTN|nr:polyketide synthase [Nonomuraea solani]SEG19855.1 Ketoacyl-synthetase C-terminal extension [Nonomuraea solani]